MTPNRIAALVGGNGTGTRRRVSSDGNGTHGGNGQRAEPSTETTEIQSYPLQVLRGSRLPAIECAPYVASAALAMLLNEKGCENEATAIPIDWLAQEAGIPHCRIRELADNLVLFNKTLIVTADDRLYMGGAVELHRIAEQFRSESRTLMMKARRREELAAQL